MEYVFVNDWFVYWFAVTTLTIWTAVSFLVVVGAVFVTTIVYDIYRQVRLKWAIKNN